MKTEAMKEEFMKARVMKVRTMKAEDEHYDLEKVYDYYGWIVKEGMTGTEYKYHMRSYTGTHIYFYLQVIDGDIYMQEQDPVTNEFGARTYAANAYDYIKAAPGC